MRWLTGRWCRMEPRFRPQNRRDDALRCCVGQQAEEIKVLTTLEPKFQFRVIPAGPSFRTPRRRQTFVILELFGRFATTLRLTSQSIARTSKSACMRGECHE